MFKSKNRGFTNAFKIFPALHLNVLNIIKKIPIFQIENILIKFNTL